MHMVCLATYIANNLLAMSTFLFYRSRLSSTLTYDQVLSYCSNTTTPQFTSCEVSFALISIVWVLTIQLQVIFINSTASGATKITQIAYGGLLLIAFITATIF